MIELVFDDATQSVHGSELPREYCVFLKEGVPDNAAYVILTLLSNASTFEIIMVVNVNTSA